MEGRREEIRRRGGEERRDKVEGRREKIRRRGGEKR